MSASTITAESAVVQRTLELCQAIVDQPSYQTLRQHIEEFLADDEAKSLYRSVVEKSEYLTHKQQVGTPAEQGEIDAFERERERLMGHPIAQRFIQAQQELQRTQDAIHQFVAKTLEEGRVPEADEFSAGNCGHGCGCHH
jgi:cell fate (sporulation/competence/biofilm development) regulator YlbF (YheA/YmcA/DUF963 family)